jgi:hypothetical protein
MFESKGCLLSRPIAVFALVVDDAVNLFSCGNARDEESVDVAVSYVRSMDIRNIVE